LPNCESYQGFDGHVREKMLRHSIPLQLHTEPK
jgi:hypothetical protein